MKRSTTETIHRASIAWLVIALLAFTVACNLFDNDDDPVGEPASATVDGDYGVVNASKGSSSCGAWPPSSTTSGYELFGCTWTLRSEGSTFVGSLSCPNPSRSGELSGTIYGTTISGSALLRYDIVVAFRGVCNASGTEIALDMTTWTKGEESCPIGGSHFVLRKNHRRAQTVFVSSASFSGNFGGQYGANTRCQALAANAGLPGSFGAWLSGQSYPAAALLPLHNVPYALVDGTRIAENPADLLDSTIEHPINVDEYGTTLDGGYGVWTGTLYNGTLASPNCDNWSRTDAFGTVGFTERTNSEWTNVGQDYCWAALRLYCFEQMMP